MSIYIKGFEVPEIEVMNGISLCLFKSYGGDIRIRNNGTGEVFDVFPVPPHGRLIDADALIKELTLDDEDDNSGASLLMMIFLEVLKAAPTIIEAKEERMTWGDKIRAMADEELAQFIWDAMVKICPNNCHEDPERPCTVCILDWLKQEVKE